MIECSNGIVVSGHTRIVLDGKKEEGINVISHAHKDHLGRIKKAVATRETAILAGLEGYKERLVLDDLEIRLVNAGHILGSSQVEILDGYHIAYTGDIRLKDSLLFKGGEILNPDILIIESTFGLPSFSFPDPEEIYDEISRWVKANLSAGRNVLLGGYSLGKAQELTRLVNEIGETPIVVNEIWKNNEIYSEMGVNVGEYLLAGTRESKEESRDPSVFLVPMKMVSWETKQLMNVSYGRPTVVGIATGWARVFSFKSKGVDRAFPLSDHADFNDLIRYARESGAKRIYTVHGYKNELARYLRKEGLSAEALNK